MVRVRIGLVLMATYVAIYMYVARVTMSMVLYRYFNRLSDGLPYPPWYDNHESYTFSRAPPCVKMF